jgi:hypothetical protein
MTLACRLDVFDAAERARYTALRRAMKAAAQERRELADGFAVRFAADPRLFRDVAEWITLARRCCPFLTLAVEWSAGDAVWLRATGEPGVKEFLATEIA